MKILFQYLLLSLPLFVNAQRDYSGIWKLKTKIRISGPDYDNGLPSIIGINQFGNSIEIKPTYFSDGKYYSEPDTMVLGDSALETITKSNRKKKVRLYWDNKSRTWKMQLEWSAKNDYSKPEIKIEQTIEPADNINELTFRKTYTGANTPGGNQDYSMIGIYEKTTSENLALDTARGNGIQFIEGLNWQQIVDLAKKENKFIFVDCYATWCLPCKKMDSEVYPLNIVGQTINDKFISLKVQMDTNAKDNEAIKLTYPIARSFEREFDIRALPSFLFFNPSGEIVHKGMGAQPPDAFITIIREATDSSSQLYSLFRKAENGELSPKQLCELTDKIGTEYRDSKLVKALVRNYVDNYLQKLSFDSLLMKENVQYLNRYRWAVSSSDRFFKICLANPKKFDSIEGQKGSTVDFVQAIITNEEISENLENAIKTKQAPSWVKIEKTIAEKYGKYYATICIVNAKVWWYGFTKQWQLYCRYLVQQVKLDGLNSGSYLYLNTSAWNVFLHSQNRDQLETALKWSKKAMEEYEIKEKAPAAQLIDTYANILYKLGRVKEAINHEERAISLAPKYDELKETLNKMTKGIPTWISDENDRD